MQHHETLKFTYDRQWLIVPSILFLSLEIAAILGIVQNLRVGLHAHALFFAMFSLLFVISYVVVCMRRSDLTVDEQGLSASIFGIKWRYIAWRSIKYVQLSRKQTSKRGKNKVNFVFFVRSQDLNVSLQFDSDLLGITELTEEIWRRRLEVGFQLYDYTCLAGEKFSNVNRELPRGICVDQFII